MVIAVERLRACLPQPTFVVVLFHERPRSEMLTKLFQFVDFLKRLQLVGRGGGGIFKTAGQKQQISPEVTNLLDVVAFLNTGVFDLIEFIGEIFVSMFFGANLQVQVLDLRTNLVYCLWG